MSLAWDLDWDSRSDFPAVPSFFSSLSDCLNLELQHTEQYVAVFVFLSVND